MSDFLWCKFNILPELFMRIVEKRTSRVLYRQSSISMRDNDVTVWSLWAIFVTKVTLAGANVEVGCQLSSSFLGGVSVFLKFSSGSLRKAPAGSWTDMTV